MTASPGSKTLPATLRRWLPPPAAAVMGNRRIFSVNTSDGPARSGAAGAGGVAGVWVAGAVGAGMLGAGVAVCVRNQTPATATTSSTATPGKSPTRFRGGGAEAAGARAAAVWAAAGLTAAAAGFCKNGLGGGPTLRVGTSCSPSGLGGVTFLPLLLARAAAMWLTRGFNGVAVGG